MAEPAAKEAVEMADQKPSVSLDLGFQEIPGETIEDKIAHAIKNTPVVVFGKAICPWTLEVNRTFQDLGVKHSLFNVDKIVDGSKVHNALKATTKQHTVPYVYIGGELIGGCDATKAAQTSGDLFKKLNAVGIYPKGAGGFGTAGEPALPEGSKRPLSTLLYFPEVVDDRAARFNGNWGVIICILVAVFFWTPQAHWVMCGLMVDFLLRFIGGGNISPLGSLSNLCCALMDSLGSRPRWVSGQSKQFATLCGFMFSFLAFFFYMMAVHHEALQIVGLAFTCMLGVATALEGWIGFCLGCWMFGLAIQFGLLPEDTFRVYTSVRDEAEYTWEDMNKRLNEGAPKVHRHCIRSDKVHTDIDFVYKAKTDDQIKEDFNLIKHVKINHFYIHMGLAGCACAWIFAAPYERLYAPTPVGYAIAILAALLYVIWCVLYCMKMWYYFPKVRKEWQHPVSSNGFVVPFATLILFAYLLMDQSHNFAMACFWAGAPIGMAISLNKVAEWIAYRKDIEHLNVSWMIMPVSNAIAALVGPMLEVQHTNAAQFWFATAFMGWLLLFAATFYRTVFYTVEDDRIRPMLAVWVAAPAVLSVAYLSVYPVIVPPNQEFNDFIFINLHWFGIAMTLILLWTFRRGYLGRIRFDMSYWAAGFPTAAVALSSIAYNAVKPGRLSYGIAVTALAATSVVNLVLLIQTAAALVRMRIFTPDYKWGPLSFMRLTHEAFRGAIIRINKLAQVIASSDNVTPEMVADLKAAWEGLELVHDEHSKHEDQVIFKLQNDFFPGIASAATHQHEEHHEVMKTIDNLLESVAHSKSAEDAKAMAQELVAAISSYSVEMEQHMKFEEDHLAGMQRKHFNITLHKQAVRQVFDMTSAEKWYKIMPWVVNNLPMLHQRVRYLKTFLWALPERAQHIGMMVGLGVDPVQWLRVTEELPELIPRSAPGHMRYH